MFALESTVEMNEKKRADIITLAEEIAHTCHESYLRSTTKIGPEMFYFEPGTEGMTRLARNRICS